MVRSAKLLASVLVLALAAGCGPQLDLSKLAPTEVLTGWYDDGVRDGVNHVVPSVSFRLKNTDSQPASEVDLTIAFWQDGADGENDSVEVRGIGDEAIAAGAVGAPILVRAPHGYTPEGPPSDMFQHSQFKDFSAKILAKRGGKIVPIGQFKIDRRIIPHLTQTAAR